jgi:hypothetical protein
VVTDVTGTDRIQHIRTSKLQTTSTDTVKKNVWLNRGGVKKGLSKNLEKAIYEKL